MPSTAQRALPSNEDAERFVLGSILLDAPQHVAAVRAELKIPDFVLQKHQRIYRRIMDLDDRGEKIDRAIVGNELNRHHELEKCDGMTYLISLDEGLPRIPNLDSYVRIIREKSIRRRMILEGKELLKRAFIETEPIDDLLSAGSEFFRDLQGSRNGQVQPEAPAAPAWPEPIGEEGFHGVAGDLVHLLEPHTEADEAALLIQFLVAWGSLINRAAHYKVESDFHYSNEYVVLVGASSKARKGTSWGRIESVLGIIDGHWSEKCLLRGLGSGEALIDALGGDDKRQLILEAEFARLLAVLNREGSTLSHNLRDLWDKGLASIRTRQNSVRVTGAHLSMIGHITGNELRRRLNDTEMANGFGNRILWICVKRSKELPRGGGSPDFAPILRRIEEATQFARRNGNSRIDFDDEAGPVWNRIYSKLSGAVPGLLGDLTGRAEAHVPRLAVTYALLDQSSSIGLEHLRAALAVWDYSFRSARFIWGDSLGDPTADKILRALRAAEAGLTRTEIRDLMARNETAQEIDRALGVLAGLALARFETAETGGRRVTRWWACS